MNIYTDKSVEIATSVLDLLAFFMVAPEILGEELFDRIVDMCLGYAMRALNWFFFKGMEIILAIIVGLAFLFGIPLFYLGKMDYIGKPLSYSVAALVIFGIALIYTSVSLGVFRELVPPGSPRRQWMVGGAVLFVVARVLSIGHALGLF